MITTVVRFVTGNQGLALFVAGLLALQALAVTHAFDHPALDEPGHDCVVCTHGHGPEPGPPAAPPALPAIPGHGNQSLPRHQTAVTRDAPTPRSRGPPARF